MTDRQAIFEKLKCRRRKLGLSESALAERSGVSLPTIQRILTGHSAERYPGFGRWERRRETQRILAGQSPAASIENAVAIAQAMGMQWDGVQMDVVPMVPAQEVLEQQAQMKAERLVGMVQGTSALEAQAVSPWHLGLMIQKTVQELLAGSRRRLWAK